MLSILVFLLVFTGALIAQDFQGVATYKSRRQVDLKMEGKNMTDAMQKQLTEQLKKQFEKTYTLSFTRNESLYKENEKLATPDVASSGGFQIKVSQSQDILYKNTSEKRYERQEDVLGKLFLVQDSLQMPQWKLEKETKSIGDYTCFKATRSEEVTNQTFESDSMKTVDTTYSKTVTVWYTPQIPVSHGPAMNWGLPGLILEVQDGKQSILCSQIVINTDEKIDIEAPEGGKIVDEASIKVIQEEKMKEWIERNSSNRGDGNSFTIKTGG
ncbi:GLPGLI family protein [Leeuwenhoekiella marinoflava DSM 3653]|uniref:GLPGLI family protein n=3 Tax=Leeuwenhoekiella marinoflava TaxID=988 RepID=A0A4Q0PNU0_9FLAO|nr:GLPGLI family protein [Leeuwenhoekiella marinoflava]SHE98670.1 GLPGLI family protein [Leeuwenhoekiella marinoflava DSM 3653]